jgi:HSP20 family protein
MSDFRSNLLQNGLSLLEGNLNNSFSEQLSDFLSDQNLQIWKPQIDMIETDSNIIIISSVPGIDENDIDVDFFNNCIVIKGERKCLSLQEEILKRKQEIYYGSFERKILIPFSVTSDQSVSIKMENGFLIININKKMELTNRFTLKPKKENDNETKL